MGHPALLLPGGLEREQGFPLERPPAFAILPKVRQRYDNFSQLQIFLSF